MSFKDISSSGGHFVQGNGTSCVILVKGIMGNNSVIFFGIWSSSSGKNAVKNSSYLELKRPSYSAAWNHLCNFR